MRKPRSEYPSEQADKFLVRLPDGLRGRLAEVARQNGRSMNAEIVHRLENSLEDSLIRDKLESLDASLEPHERVIVMFQEAMDAMLRVKTTIKREYGVETYLQADSSDD